MSAPLPTASRWNTHSRSRYPGLWDGIVHAWCPSVLWGGAACKPTHSGANTRDLSIGTNPLDQCWEVSGGGLSLKNTATTVEAFHAGTATELNTASVRSYACWARVPYTSMIFFLWDLAVGVNQRTIILAVNGSGQLNSWWSLYGSDNGTNVVGGSVVANTWNHYVQQWDEQKSERQVFLNGKLTLTAAQGAASTTASNNRLGVLAVPGRAGDNVAWFDYQRAALGNVDDIRLYRRALHSEEIRLLATRRAIAYEPKYRPAYYTETDAGSGGGVASRPYAYQSARMIGAGR